MIERRLHYDLSQMWNENGQLALPGMRLPRDPVSEEEGSLSQGGMPSYLRGSQITKNRLPRVTAAT